MKYWIGFSTKKNSAFSRLIRWVIRFPASHSFIFFDEKVILESTIFNVRMQLWKYFEKNNSIVQIFEIKTKKSALKNALVIMEQYYGDRYDFRNIIGHFIVRIVDILFHKRINNFLGDKQKFQCSEFVYKYLTEAGFNIEIDNPEEVTPRILFDFCMENSKYFKPKMKMNHQTYCNMSSIYYLEKDYQRALFYINKALETGSDLKKYTKYLKKIEKGIKRKRADSP